MQKKSSDGGYIVDGYLFGSHHHTQTTSIKIERFDLSKIRVWIASKLMLLASRIGRAEVEISESYYTGMKSWLTVRRISYKTGRMQKVEPKSPEKKADQSKPGKKIIIKVEADTSEAQKELGKVKDIADEIAASIERVKKAQADVKNKFERGARRTSGNVTGVNYNGEPQLNKKDYPPVPPPPPPPSRAKIVKNI